MTVRIIAFGIAKEIVGAPFIEWSVAEALSVKRLKETLEKNYPRLQELAFYRIALNNEFAEEDQQVQPQDEIAIIPPVSGG